MSTRVGDDDRKRRPLRRLALLSLGPLTAVVAVFGLISGGGGSTSADDAAKSDQGTSTATVERKTLVEREKVDGTLGYGKSTTVFNRGQGTVTKLAAEGSVVERNGVLYELDGKAVRLMYGELPSFRRLAEGVPDGADIQQLEGNLKELGFTKGLISKPDNKWDEATTAAVKRWQKATGVDQDGVIEDGEIVFLPKTVRVSAHKVSLGSAAQPGAVLEVTGTSREVSIDLDARKQRLAQQGAKADVELPDGTTVTGTISSVGTVAKSKGGDGEDAGDDSDSKPTLPVTVTLDSSAAGGNLDGAPVKVRLVRSTREGVLTVPVQALLALAEGGYGIEVAEGAGRRLMRVDTGLFAEGMVEVSGEGITQGMNVVVSQ